MIKILLRVVFIGVLLMLASLALWQHYEISGSNKLLKTIKSIREGSTKEEVLSIMGVEPQVTGASGLPYWMKEVVDEKDVGEYWFFFMGYPPRNLIIYFDKDEKVSFVTWTHT